MRNGFISFFCWYFEGIQNGVDDCLIDLLKTLHLQLHAFFNVEGAFRTTIWYDIISKIGCLFWSAKTCVAKYNSIQKFIRTFKSKSSLHVLLFWCQITRFQSPFRLPWSWLKCLISTCAKVNFFFHSCFNQVSVNLHIFPKAFVKKSKL